ncbi:MAG: pentapeptide repeat-containing protein [Nitrospinales bacterium]
MEGANLEGANLEEANLEGAIIAGTDMEGVTGLTCEQIKSASVHKKYPEFLSLESHTILPEYLVVTWNDSGSLKNCTQ